MSEQELPAIASSIEAFLFAAAGLANLLPPASVRRFYQEFDVRPGFYRAIGVVELAIAPAFWSDTVHIWADLSAGAILLGAGALLLDRGRYRFATVTLFMIGLLFVSATRVPSHHSTFNYVTVSPSQAG